MDALEALKSAIEWGRASARRERALAPYRAEFDRLAPMDTEAVKRLWDAYDGNNEPSGFSPEAIHMELNRRGEGEYCAV